MNRRSFLALASGTPLLHSQQAPQPPADEQTITLDVTRVNLLFTVTDKRGRFVTDLVKDDFDVFEGKRKQTVLEFAAESNLPLRVGLLVDTSNSIRDRFKFQLEAAGQFLQSVIRPDADKAVIYTFDTSAELVQDFTGDTETLAKKLRGLRPGGGTSLYDAIVMACRDKMMLDRPMHKFRRAIVMVGDGDDNASRHTRDQALEWADRAEVVLFCISTNITKQESEGDKVLKYFAKQTGGLAFFPFKAEDLIKDFENIANELRSQYSLLYRPDPYVADGSYHPVDVRIKKAGGFVVRARQGYYARPDGR